MVLGNPSIFRRVIKAPSATPDQNLQVMHSARVSCRAFHTESDEVAVQDALVIEQG